MTLLSRLALSLAAVTALPLGPAFASDYDPPIIVDEQPEYVPVEVGSGWYLRGDIGYAFSHPFDHEQTPPGFRSDASLFAGTIGMGYHINDMVRAELNLGILPTDKFSESYMTTCDGTVTTTVTDTATGTLISQGTAPGARPCQGSNGGSNKAYSLMAAGFIDLGTISGFTPYVGGGAGIAYSKFRRATGGRDCEPTTTTTSGGGSTTVQQFDCDSPAGYGSAVTSDGAYNFAYSLAAGLNYQVSKNVSVDVGYEYFAVPGARYVAYDAGGFNIKKGVDYHQVKVGFRYDLW